MVWGRALAASRGAVEDKCHVMVFPPETTERDFSPSPWLLGRDSGERCGLRKSQALPGVVASTA